MSNIDFDAVILPSSQEQIASLASLCKADDDNLDYQFYPLKNTSIPEGWVYASEGALRAIQSDLSDEKNIFNPIDFNTALHLIHTNNLDHYRSGFLRQAERGYTPPSYIADRFEYLNNVDFVDVLLKMPRLPSRLEQQTLLFILSYSNIAKSYDRAIVDFVGKHDEVSSTHRLCQDWVYMVLRHKKQNPTFGCQEMYIPMRRSMFTPQMYVQWYLDPSKDDEAISIGQRRVDSRWILAMKKLVVSSWV